MKYKQWLYDWLESGALAAVKPRTAEAYADAVRLRIVPELGECELSELTADVLQSFVRRISERYSPNTVLGAVTVVRASLKRAQKTGVLERQYSDCIICPRVTEREIFCLTVSEQKRIEKYVLSSSKKKYFGFVLCLYTGLRIGGLLALEWRDIDLCDGYLSVNKTCRDSWRGGYSKIVSTPKTKTSRRVIPLPVKLLPYLRKMKKSACGACVFTTESGGAVTVRSFQRSFQCMLRKLGIEHRGVHALRHTFATRALECGMDVRTLSEILGHKNPSVTLNRYAHSLLPHKAAMMNRLGKLFAE